MDRARITQSTLSHLRRIVSGVLVAVGICFFATKPDRAQPQSGGRPNVGDFAYAFRFSPDGQILAIARGTTDSGRVELWDPQTATLRRVISGFDGPVLSVSFSPDGKTLITGSSEFFQSQIEKSPLRGRTSAALKWWDVKSGELKRQLTVPGNDRMGVKALYSPDGRSLAALEYYWNFRLGFDGYFDATAPLPSVRKFLVSEADLSLLDSQTGETRLRLKKGINALDYPVSFSPRSMQTSILRLGVQRSDHAIFSPDGHMVAAWNWNEVVLWDAVSGTEIYSFTKFNHQLRAIAFSPDSKTLAAAFWKTRPNDYWKGMKSEIRLYDLTSGNETRTLTPNSPAISSLAFDLEGKILLVGGWERDDDRQQATLELIDVNEGSLGGLWTGKDGPVTALVMSPNGRSLAWQSNSTTVNLLDTQTWTIKHTFDEKSDTSTIHRTFSRFLLSVKSVLAVAFSNDGKTVTGKIEAGGIKRWDSRTGEVKKQLPESEAATSLAEIAADGSKTLEMDDESIRLSDLTTGADAEIAQNQKVNAIALSPGGEAVALAYLNQIILIDTASRKVIRTLESAPSGITHLCFSVKRELLAAANEAGTITVWNLRDGQIKTSLSGAGAINALRFAPTPNLLATADKIGSVNLWDLSTGMLILQLRKHKAPVNAIAFSASGNLLATGGDDRTVIIWDPASGKPRRMLKGHDLSVTSLAFSPDARLIACGTGNASVVLWDVESGRPERVLQ